MSYNVILFTDSNDHLYHAKTLGPYRIASELRSQGYSVLVVDYFGHWLNDFKSLNLLLEKAISKETLFIGFSGVFFSLDSSVISEENSFDQYRKERFLIDAWPAELDLINQFHDVIRTKFSHVKLVYGGLYNNEKYKHIVNLVDYVVTGVADSTVIDLANHLKNNTRIKYSPSLKYMQPSKKCKIIDYDVKGLAFDFHNSATLFNEDDNVVPGEVLPLETSRGCMFKCSFCDFPLIGRKKNSTEYIKKVENVAAELKNNYEKFNITKYMIVDDTFNESTEKIESMLRARDLSGVNIEFCSYIRLDLVSRFPEQISLLRELGIRAAFLGIESLDWESAKAIGKGIHPNRSKETIYAMKDAWKDQVSLHGHFIVGLPNDNPETLDRWVPWVIDDNNPLSSVFFGPLGIFAKGFSDIANNPVKYGYTVTKIHNSHSTYWSNQHWDFRAAAEYARDIMNPIWESGRVKVGKWEIMGLQNLGYSFEELISLPIKDLSKRAIKNKVNIQWTDYKAALLKKLS